MLRGLASVLTIAVPKAVRIRQVKEQDSGVQDIAGSGTGLPSAISVCVAARPLDLALIFEVWDLIYT